MNKLHNSYLFIKQKKKKQLTKLCEYRSGFYTEAQNPKLSLKVKFLVLFACT